MIGKIALRIQRPLHYLTCSMPLALMMGCYWFPQSPLLWWILPLIHIAWIIPFVFVKGKVRLVLGIAGAICLIVCGVYLLPWQSNAVMILFPAIYALLTLLAMPFGGLSTDTEMPPWPMIGGAILYLIGQFLVSHGYLIWHGMQTPLHVCFLFYMLLSMMVMNRSGLQNATFGHGAPPAVIKRFGLFLTIGSFVLIVLIAIIPAIGQALSRAWSFLKTALLALLELLMPVPSENAGGGGGSMADFAAGLGENAEPSLLAQILEKIFGVVAIILVLVLAFVFLRVIIKTLRKVLRRIMEHLRAFAASSTADYVDEAVDTRDEAQSKSSFMHRVMHPVRLGDLRNLEPRARIRAVYAYMRQKHPVWTAASTARSTLPDDAATLYEKARYSSHELTQSDAEQFMQSTKTL